MGPVGLFELKSVAWVLEWGFVGWMMQMEMRQRWRDLEVGMDQLLLTSTRMSTEPMEQVYLSLTIPNRT